MNEWWNQDSLISHTRLTDTTYVIEGIELDTQRKEGRKDLIQMRHYTLLVYIQPRSYLRLGT